MSSTPFATRLAAVMIAAVLAASALTISLNYFKTRRVLRTQEDLVYSFVADDLASTIEDGMNLGISLAMLQTTEQLIQRRRAAESGTLSISVFDATGAVLFDTDQFRVGRRLPPDWAPQAAEAAEWRADAPGAFVVGARITNSFGQPAGGVVVRYDPVPLETRVNTVLLDMVRAGLLALVVTAAIAAFAAPLLTRPLRHWLSRASADITRAQLVPAGEAPVGEALGESSPVLAAVAKASQDLADAEDALMRLGMAESDAAADRSLAA